MIEFEPGWWKGKYVIVEDRGPVSKGAKTRVYRITSKGQVLGHVKWVPFWRKYALFTHNAILENECMDDISQFIQERTKERKDTWKYLKSIVDWDLVAQWENEGGKTVTHVENQ